MQVCYKDTGLGVTGKYSIAPSTTTRPAEMFDVLSALHLSPGRYHPQCEQPDVLSRDEWVRLVTTEHSTGSTPQYPAGMYGETHIATNVPCRPGLMTAAKRHNPHLLDRLLHDTSLGDRLDQRSLEVASLSERAWFDLLLWQLEQLAQEVDPEAVRRLPLTLTPRRKTETEHVIRHTASATTSVCSERGLPRGFPRGARVRPNPIAPVRYVEPCLYVTLNCLVQITALHRCIAPGLTQLQTSKLDSLLYYRSGPIVREPVIMRTSARVQLQQVLSVAQRIKARRH